jgi:hypothetical protein
MLQELHVHLRHTIIKCLFRTEELFFYPTIEKELRTEGKVEIVAVLRFCEADYHDISAEFLWRHQNKTASSFIMVVLTF